MATTDHPTPVSPGLHRPGLTIPTPPANLHLVDGLWFASCPTCTFQLCHGRTQQRVERRAARILCPVCHEDRIG
jgi:hypothetical protein